DDDTPADAGAHGEENHAAVLAPGAGPVLAIGGGVGVVDVGNGIAAGAADEVANRRVVPVGQVAGAEEHAGLEVHRARGGEADAGDVSQVEARFVDQRADGGANAVGCVGGSPFLMGRNRAVG